MKLTRSLLSIQKPSFWMWLGVVVLILSTWFVYWPVARGSFLWDDEYLVLRNPLIRSPVLGIEVFRHFLFTDSKGEFYRPIQNVSYIFDYWRHGLNASAFHKTNIFLHSLNGVLVILLIRRLLVRFGNLTYSSSGWLAIVISAFWVLHPVHSAIPAYVSGRADSLALGGLLGAWLCWEKGREISSQPRYIWFLLAFLLALAACCSKEIALAGLGFFLLYLWIFRPESSSASKWKSTLGTLGIFCIYIILRQLPEANIAPPGGESVSWLMKGNLVIRAMGDYIRLLVYPAKLFMERQVSQPTGLFTDPVKNDPLFPYLGIIGLLWIVLLVAATFWRGHGQRLRQLGALWFGIMILPVSNLFNLNATIAEHWLYIPSIGAFLFVAGCCLDIGKNYQRFALMLVPFLIVILGWRTYERAEDWSNPISFYRATVRDGGDSIRIRINLAGEYQKLGNLIEAERIYRSTLRALPNFTVGKTMLAQNLILQNRRVDAAKIMAEIAPNQILNMTERVATLDLLRETKQYVDARKMARQAYEKNPNSWPLALALAKIYQSQNQSRVSLEIVKGFTDRNWWHADAQNLLGELYAEDGRSEEAIAAYLEAARLDIRNAEPLNQASILATQIQRYDEALKIQNKAIVRSDAPRQREILQLIQAEVAKVSKAP